MNASPRRPAHVTDEQWLDWRWQLRNQITTLAELEGWVGLTDDERAAVIRTQHRFRLGITPYYASLMDPGDPACPIRRQSVPTLAELEVHPLERADPLDEDGDQVVPGLTRRYRDRVLLYTSHVCPVYCRHCTRRRKVSDPASAPPWPQIEHGLDWIAGHPEVRDVVLSGGDPLSMSNRHLGRLLGRVRDIRHVEVVRLGTRYPTTAPQRVDDGLLDVISAHSPLYVMTHFNHPRELTPLAVERLGWLARAGGVLANQTVLLRGVNDDLDVLRELSQELLRAGVRPYRWFHCDYSEGTSHFRTRIDDDRALLDALETSTSGLAVPQLVVDLPGGRGKASIGSSAAVRLADGTWRLRGSRGDPIDLI